MRRRLCLEVKNEHTCIRVIHLCFYVTVCGKLKDGIPELQQNITFSPPSVPSEKEHASCSRVEMDLPFFPSVPDEVLNAANTIWRKAHTRRGGHGKFLYYSSKDDVAYFVRRFLEDILLALNILLDFNAEVTIKQFDQIFLYLQWICTWWVW
mmetsp:Transcript_18757/g.27118  ORF Transcript_18757/g.27118 Transcript_18757/m.27118 type:complete len:152 (-) Transcript_18757:1004-1459(-)